MAFFDNSNRDDEFRGTTSEYDQVNYSGYLTDYILVRDTDGSVVLYQAGGENDVLVEIDGFWFLDEKRWFSIEQALEISNPDALSLTDVLYFADGFIEGWVNNDLLIGDNRDNVFYGGQGDDLIDGHGGDYNQVNYDGSLSDYVFTENFDGSITVSSGQWGTDTLYDIDGFWFAGEARWYSLADALDLSLIHI